MKNIIIMLLLLLGSVTGKTQKQKAPADYHHIAQTQFIEANGIKYAYRVLGDKTGIPIILLQGSLWNMDDWDPSITNGLAQYNKVILFDNKGVGATNGKTPDNIQDMAKDAVSFIRALGYEKVNVLGLSMGGMITQQILLTETGLIDKVILAGTGPKGSIGLSEVVNTATKASTLLPADQANYLLFGPSDHAKLLGKLSLERIYRRTLNRDVPVTNETNIAQLTAVIGWSKSYANAFNELKTISNPTLIIEGRYDILVPVVNSFNLYNNMPNAKLSCYPDAGHASLFQRPDLFLADAIPFLKER